ncbi:peptidylprolyl isomerase [Oenococcus sicerae]|uniref:peptidylprolyl isomerase n=2 Tax=Oenococcus sicerae TaxID=2203724 RepID=UPI0010B8F6B7|nr:Foldase protein PrsA precursor [Oenococcus sicerae]
MRKFVWTAIVLLFLAGSAYLALNTSKVLVTSKSGAITEAQYMSSVTKTSAGEQLFVSMVMNNSLEKFYGKSVAQSVVDSEYSQQKAQYGSSWSTYLSEQSTTASAYKKQVRTQLLLIQAVKDYHKVSAAQLKKAYQSYTPKMSVSTITVSSSAKADTVLKDLKAGKSFASEAKANSSDTSTASKGGLMPSFDSTSSVVSSSIIKAAKGLKVGSYTEQAVKSNSAYVIVKLNSRAEKKSISTYKNILTNSIINTWVNNSNNTTKIQKIIGKVMNKNDVQVKSSSYPTLKNAIDQYIISNSSSTTTSSSSSSSAKSSSSK